MQELEQAGVLVTGLDKEGHVYYAHKTADMDIACAIKVRSREVWKEWQVSVLSKSPRVHSPIPRAMKLI